jgi:hypothetical protein
MVNSLETVPSSAGFPWNEVLGSNGGAFVGNDAEYLLRLLIAPRSSFNGAKLALRRSVDSMLMRKRSMVLKQESKALLTCC